MNCSFTYLYRDASNYKQWGNTVFSDPENISRNQNAVSRSILRVLMVDGTFVADQVGLPELFRNMPNWPSGEDHCLHEFHGVEVTLESPTDPSGRTISEFIAQLEAVSHLGWQGFEVYQSTGHRRHFKFVL